MEIKSRRDSLRFLGSIKLFYYDVIHLAGMTVELGDGVVAGAQSLEGFLKYKLGGKEPKRLAIWEDVPNFVRLFLSDPKKSPDLGLVTERILRGENRKEFSRTAWLLRAKYRIVRSSLDLMGPIGFAQSPLENEGKASEVNVTNLAAALIILSGDTSITGAPRDAWMSSNGMINMEEVEVLVGAHLYDLHDFDHAKFINFYAVDKNKG